MRALHYLQQSKDLGLNYPLGEDLTLSCMSDSEFASQTKDGKSNGLTLLLDYNTERSVLPVKIDRTDVESKNIFLDLDTNVEGIFTSPT